MSAPHNNQEYLLSPDWVENGHSFDIRYYWNDLEPRVVLVSPKGQLVTLPLSEAVERGIISRKTACHAKVVSRLIRTSVENLPNQTEA